MPELTEEERNYAHEKYKEERQKRFDHGMRGFRVVPSAYKGDPFTKEPRTSQPIREHVDVVVVGAGITGMVAAARLVLAGVTNLKIVEKFGDFGGTWYLNRYPGLRCDIEAYLYMPLLEEVGYMPSETYATCREIRHHLQAIGKKFDLYDKALFGTEVKSAKWDENSQIWKTSTSYGDEITSDFVILSCGPISYSRMPTVPGNDTFKGKYLFPNRWDFSYTGGDELGNLTKLSDKRVGIVGTGASTVGCLPLLGKYSKELYVFQRTPATINVRNVRKTDEDWTNSLREGWQAERQTNFSDATNIAGINDIEDDMVQDGWTKVNMRTKQLLAGKDPSKLFEMFAQADDENMAAIRARVDDLVDDPSLAEKLKPWFNTLCKRPLFDEDYLRTFNLPNVHLVDTDGRGIDSVNENGIVANDTQYDLDAIIWATGYKFVFVESEITTAEVIGRDNQTLSNKWKDGAKSLFGVHTRDFPNLLIMSTVQGIFSTNYSYMAEKTAEHIAWVVSNMKERGISTVEPTSEAEEEWANLAREKGIMLIGMLQACPPGTLSKDGELDLANPQNAPYFDSTDIRKRLEAWRKEGQFKDMDIRMK